MGIWGDIERKLERAYNESFARAFKSEVQPVELASAIRKAMDDRSAVLGRGRTMVPNLFLIELSPTDYDRIAPIAGDVEIELVAAAEEHAESQHYQPGGPIRVDFERGDDLETGVFRVRPSTVRHPDNAPSGAPSPTHHPAEAPGRPVAHEPEPPARRPNIADRPWLDVDGDRYPLVGAITVLGRDDTADVILDDPGISRRHAEVRVTTDGPHLNVTLRDLGSTNGTFVNSERISSQRLEDGDRVTVGRTTVTFRAGRR